MTCVLDKVRFEQLWSRVATAGEAPDCRAAWQELVQCYSEPGRYYHSDAHVAFCLSELDRVRNGPAQTDLVELSIWFHDLVYEATGKDNERRSAERFVELAQGQLEPASIDSVYRFIMATVHTGEPGSLDAQFVVDIDLAGMGCSWEHYLEDSEALRRERPDQGDKEFFGGKRAFLEGLLARPSIYHTKDFLERREERARANITRYLADRVYPLVQ